jgi:hypothetical protein
VTSLQDGALSVYTALTAAGANPGEAQVLTAIAGAESGFDITKVGDRNLVDAKWGPSVGWFQIRTLIAQRGTGGDRDELALTASASKQARSALAIARGPNRLHNWTTYNTGAYGAFLKYAEQAGNQISDDADGSARTTLGQLGNTVGAVGNGVVTAAGGALSGIDAVGAFLGALTQRATWIRVVSVVGGSGLIALGIGLLGKDIAAPVVSAAANLNPVTAAAKTAAHVAKEAGK